MAVESNRDYAKGLARAFGGALLFAFPLLMTMEMWQFGFHMEPLRLALFLTLGVPLLFGLSYYGGFRDTTRWPDDLIDAFAAYAVGFIASAALLVLFGVVAVGMAPREIVGTIGVQALPAAMGAVLARRQFSAEDHEERTKKERRKSYASELFLMTAGSLFVAFNVAPTEEMILIAYQMTPWHALALVAGSLLLLHALVFRLGFAGQEVGHDSGSGWRTFLHFTLAGYGIALAVSLYILWTFSRTESGLNPELATAVVVLGFPAAIGAALARLLV